MLLTCHYLAQSPDMSDASVEQQQLDAAHDLRARLVDLEQQLEYMRQQQEVLLYTMSHDLRTPVMTILGFTDMLISDRKELSEDQLARQYLEHIRNSATRQAALIESLLSYSRLAKQVFRSELVDLTGIASDYWRVRQAANSHVHMTLQPTAPVNGDRAMLTQALVALLDNAIKFTDKQAKPEITFGAEQLQGSTTYFVRDNGVGFDVQRAERLFQPFRRLHSSKDYEGLGMGLANAALIVQRHRGRLWADSHVEHGTTLYFTLGTQ